MACNAFGLSNAPSTFMRLMNEVLKDFIGIFVVVYLDDILIYKKTNQDHIKHVDAILKRLHEEKLAINLDKCDFFKQELVYLGFLVSQGTLKMDKEKVVAILDWSTPTTSTKVRSLHGLSQFYRKFIRNFSFICAPLLDTIKGGVKSKFKQTLKFDKSFDMLNKQVATQPIPQLPNFEKAFTLECDGSGLTVGGVLSQEGIPVAFYREKLNEDKKEHLNYD